MPDPTASRSGGPPGRAVPARAGSQGPDQAGAEPTAARPAARRQQPTRPAATGKPVRAPAPPPGDRTTTIGAVGADRTSGPGGPNEPGGPGGPTAGDLVGGRYRLDTVVSTGHTVLWRADDEVLARRVAVRVLAGGATAGVRAAFVRAAATAGQVTATGLASVYDAATEASPEVAGGAPVTYVVSEWVDGKPLDSRLREAPLAPAEATSLITSLATTVETAHRQGVYARRLHPAQVLLTRGTGAPKLTDLEIAAASRGGATEGEGARTEAVREDTRDLARVLYACVTGYWPDPGWADPWTRLPNAPVQDGRLCLPRQVRAGLPRSLDTVIARTLDQARRPSDLPITTPRELREALAGLSTPGAPVAATEPEEIPLARKRRFRRRWLIIPAVLWLVALGVAGWLIGLVLGRVPNPSSTASKVPGLHASPTASGSAGTSAGAVIDLTAPGVDVKSFDPEGDKSENETAVPYAFDQDPTTSWVTEQYNSPSFGGLKTGVGLLVDLGKARTVTKVTVQVPAGESLELLAASPALTTDPTSAGQTPAVTASITAAPGMPVTLTPSAPTMSRYYVVWLTSLPPLTASAKPAAAGQFEGEITDMTFYG